MTSDPRPAAVPFDPGSGELPPALEPVLTDPENPILLLVAADADDAAARTAIALADLRGARGLPTVLADADLDAPRLHRLLDVENLEGLVDVFLFGASLSRVTVRPDTRRFELAPAGAYAPDPAEVLQSPRWDRIAEELPAGQALLLVFLPAAAAGVRELSRRIGRAVILGDDRAVERAALRLDPACRVLGAVQPPPDMMAPARLAAQAGPIPAGARTIFDGPDLSEPLVIRQRKRERAVSPLLIALLVLVVLGGAAWFGYRELMGRSAPAPVAVPAPVEEEPAPQDPGALLATPLPYSVAVEAHQDLEAARERARQLDAAESATGFYLAPVSVRGTLYYRLLAGPITDREQGLEVMRRLVEARHKTAMDDWAVRPTTFAFHLGDFDTPGEADSRVGELTEAGIPAYVVPQRYESGQVLFRVYGGAYENEAEADVMREMLENAGETARLIPRVGEPEA